MSTKETAKSLIAERDEIDALIEENLKVLEANGCTMDNSLVDEEGFPIAIIDVYSVRHARNAIICARNDRAALTERLGEAIQNVHQEESFETPQSISSSAASAPREPPVHRTSNTPFAKVSTVTTDSPAALGGISVGDLIIQYGQLHHGNFKDMKQLAEITNNNEEKIIRVTVMRNMRPVRLEICPKKWNGKGLLGCGIVPETTAEII